MKESMHLRHAKLLLALAELKLDLMGGINHNVITIDEFNALCEADSTIYWKYWEKWIEARRMATLYDPKQTLGLAWDETKCHEELLNALHQYIQEITM